MLLCVGAVQLPVLVSDLDLECKMWIKLRLAPMCPYIGSISLAFVGAPNVKVQLLPYNRVRIMRIPILQVRARLGHEWRHVCSLPLSLPCHCFTLSRAGYPLEARDLHSSSC